MEGPSFFLDDATEKMISEHYCPCPATLKPPPCPIVPLSICQRLLTGRISGLISCRVGQSVGWSVSQSVCPSIRPSVHPSVCPSDFWIASGFCNAAQSSAMQVLCVQPCLFVSFQRFPPTQLFCGILIHDHTSEPQIGHQIPPLRKLWCTTWTHVSPQIHHQSSPISWRWRTYYLKFTAGYTAPLHSRGRLGRGSNAKNRSSFNATNWPWPTDQPTISDQLHPTDRPSEWATYRVARLNFASLWESKVRHFSSIFYYINHCKKLKGATYDIQIEDCVYASEFLSAYEWEKQPLLTLNLLCDFFT